MRKKNIENIIDINNFSTLKKLLIITSWALLFISSVKSNTSDGIKLEQLFK